MSTDSIGDFLSIIRNGIMASKRTVNAPFSNIRFEIASLLKSEGYIKDVVVEDTDSVKKELKVFLKYVSGESVIHEIKRISKPGKRQYSGAKTIKPVIGKLGISVLTTSKGIITDKAARELSVGGEIICTVW